MSQTVDVNVLLYASNTEAPEHQRANQLVRHLAGGSSLVVLFWPTIMGYLRIATHGSVFTRPLSLGEALDNVEALTARPQVRLAGESDGFLAAYRGTVEGLSVRGNLVPDAHLATLMRQHGVRTLWSRDRDFRRFDGITLIDPFDDRFENGFDAPRRRPGKRG